MDVSRRDFLKVSGATSIGLLLGTFGFDLRPIRAYAQTTPPVWEKETISVCCYCAVGCGLIVGSKNEEPFITYVQGNPDHPINQGSLCSKGQALAQLRTVDGALNPRRLLKPMVRRPCSDKWEYISWDQALDEIAHRIKETRDGTNPQTGQPNTITEELIDGEMTPVNRCLGIANFGGAAHDNEECYILVKLMRALGLVYIEHQARI